MQALLHSISSMHVPSTAQRLFHGRGGLYPGCEQWTLDFFPPVFVLTCFQDASEESLAIIGNALSTAWTERAPDKPLNWVYQCRAQGQAQTRLMTGRVPDPHVVMEDDVQYRIHLLRGQNHGLFLDMVEGRRWVQRYVAECRSTHGLKVLNLFAYTCAFSVVALRAGARQVVNVDMSQAALAVGQQNHQLNGVGAGASFLAHDIFKTWGKVTRTGPYDLVIMDPPSYQKGSFVASKDYGRLTRRLPDLLAPEGHALLCLNAPELDSAFLKNLMQEHAPEVTFVQQVANPAGFEDVDPARALKVLVYRASASVRTEENPPAM